MSKIKSKNTKPELQVRKYLYKEGFRYRIHSKLPGKPDIVFHGLKIAIFIHGCFWHRHGCKFTSTPKTNIGFWREKFVRNQQNDKKVLRNLKKNGWKVFVIWECQIKENFEKTMNSLIKYLSKSKLLRKIKEGLKKSVCVVEREE